MGDVVVHPAYEDSPENVAEKALDYVEKARKDGETPYMIVLVGADGRIPSILNTPMFDIDFSTCLVVFQVFAQKRIESYFSDD